MHWYYFSIVIFFLAKKKLKFYCPINKIILSLGTIINLISIHIIGLTNSITILYCNY